MVRNDKPEQKYKINFTKYSKGCSFNSIDIGEYPPQLVLLFINNNTPH